MNPDTPPAVLLGGSVTSMPVLRSLGRRGVPVHALGTPENPIRHSRYCVGFTAFDEGEGVHDGWLEWLLSRAPEGAVVLPCSDDGVELVARRRERLRERGLRPVEGNDAVMLAMLDKDRTYAIAKEAGVATPLTHTVRSEADMGAQLDEFRFPCGIRPLHSHDFARLAGIRDKVIVVEGPLERDAALERALDLGLEMQMVEIVPGGDDALWGHFTYIDADGEPLGHFCNRKLRQHPIHFGVGAYVIAEETPDLIETGMRFLRAAGLRGVAHVEFKRDARDGTLKLIECNHRFNLSIALLCALGFDLPLVAYERALGRPGPELPAPAYKGTRLWHPIPDARAMLEYRRAGELTVGRWLRSLAHRQHFSLFAADDPMPSVRDHLSLPRRALQGRRRARAAASS